MTRLLPPVTCALLLAACSPDNPEPAAPREMQSPAARKPSSASTVTPGRSYEYTRLSDCRTVRSEEQEGEFIEQECPGVGGYSLLHTVGDLRANLHVIGQDGKDTSLDLSRIGGGGFSELGGTLEWRGPDAEPLAPDSLIMRYDVVEDPEGTQDVSYLLVARLGSVPCVIAKVPPGPGQNEKARALADGGGACLAG